MSRLLPVALRDYKIGSNTGLSRCLRELLERVTHSTAWTISRAYGRCVNLWAHVQVPRLVSLTYWLIKRVGNVWSDRCGSWTQISSGGGSGSLASCEASDVAYMEMVCTQFLCTTTSHPCTWTTIPRRPELIKLNSIFTYLRLTYPSVRSRLQGMQNE